MITKGEIKTIDFNSNTCTVRLPLFETTTYNKEYITKATICIPPGIYNGFSVGDKVFVAFEDHDASSAVVIGKLYLGVSAENNLTGGTVKAESVYIDNEKVDLNSISSSILNLDKKINNISSGGSGSGTDLPEIVKDKYLHTNSSSGALEWKTPEGLVVKIVSSLPSSGDANVLYLVSSGSTQEYSKYNKYLWVIDSWEIIGSGGSISSAQLTRGYYYSDNFYEDSAHTKVISKDRLKLYLDVPSGILYEYNETYFRAITVKSATDTIPGVMKLYSNAGNNTDGTMTQKAITELYNGIKLSDGGDEMLELSK